MLWLPRTEWLDETIEDFMKTGFTVEGMLCDVAVPEQVDAVVKAAVQKLGAVDILINNAGVSWAAIARGYAA